MKPQNYVEGQKFCRLTDLSAVRQIDAVSKVVFMRKTCKSTKHIEIHVEIIYLQWKLSLSEDQKCLD